MTKLLKCRIFIRIKMFFIKLIIYSYFILNAVNSCMVMFNKTTELVAKLI